MTEEISQREFIAALAAAKRQPAVQRPLAVKRLPADRTVMQVGVDMRLTLDDLAKLSPEQVQAVFEGVGRLAAAGLGR